MQVYALQLAIFTSSWVRQFLSDFHELFGHVRQYQWAHCLIPSLSSQLHLYGLSAQMTLAEELPVLTAYKKLESCFSRD